MHSRISKTGDEVFPVTVWLPKAIKNKLRDIAEGEGSKPATKAQEIIIRFVEAQ